MDNWHTADNSQSIGYALYFSTAYAAAPTSSEGPSVDETAYLLQSDANAAQLVLALEQIEVGDVVEYDPTDE